MAAAVYATDLNDITDCETNTGWSELSGHTSGAADASEDEYFMQNAKCVSQATGQALNQTAGLEYDYGSDITLAAGECIFTWQIFLAPNAIKTFVNDGMMFGIGSSSGNMDFFTTMGNDFGKYPYGGWQNSAVDPTYATPDLTDGTPAGTYRIFGSLPNLAVKVTKGSPHGVDVLRYGRGELSITGGDLANGYGTVAGMAAANDAQLARWGLLQDEGGSYRWKGLWSLGTTTAAVDFRDANRNIVVDDCPRTYAAFNKIEVNHADSNIEWTAFNISALGTLSKGSFEIKNDGAVVKHTACTFTDQATYKYGSNATVTNTIHRRCEPVSQLGGTLTSGTIDEPSTSIGVYADNLDLISNYVFNSTGTGHAVELSSIGSGSMIWDCETTGYDTGVTGEPITPTNTGNEDLFVNVASGTFTINVASGATVPSVKSAGATINIPAASYTLTLSGIESGTVVTIVNSSTRTVLKQETTTTGTVTYGHSGGEVVDILLMHNYYDPHVSNVYDWELPTSDTLRSFSMLDDPNYENN